MVPKTALGQTGVCCLPLEDTKSPFPKELNVSTYIATSYPLTVINNLQIAFRLGKWRC